MTAGQVTGNRWLYEVKYGGRMAGKTNAMERQLAAYLQSLPAGAMRVRLHSGPAPKPASGGSVSGAGYARGGLVSPGLPPGTGFARGGRLALADGTEAEPGLVLGAVTGYRWWTLPEPDFSTDPGRADETWPAELLRGQWDRWQPGLNVAVCHPAAHCGMHDRGTVPAEAGSCGYWAYWLPRPHELRRYGTMQVFGVIRASGKVLIGEEGFRAARARLLAVHLPFTLAVQAAAYERPDLGRALHRAGYSGVPGYDDRMLTYRDVPPEQDPEGYALAEAWMAVIGDRLAQVYPGVEVCETRDLLMAKYPPDRTYAPALQR